MKNYIKMLLVSSMLTPGLLPAQQEQAISDIGIECLDYWYDKGFVPAHYDAHAVSSESNTKKVIVRGYLMKSEDTQGNKEKQGSIPYNYVCITKDGKLDKLQTNLIVKIDQTIRYDDPEKFPEGLFGNPTINEDPARIMEKKLDIKKLFDQTQKK